MAQDLILFINNTRVTASWKTDAYKNSFNMVHYGVDMVSSTGVTKLYAGGNGEVLKAGSDTVLGNFVIMKFPDARNHKTGEVKDLIVRIWHLKERYVKEGDKINKDTHIANYGNTGQYTTGAHLHMEVDTDTKNYMWTPSLAGNTANFIGRNMGANDSSMTNPFEWLSCKTTSPDNQTYTTDNNAYIRPEDKTIPKITGDAPVTPPTSGLTDEVAKLQDENTNLKAELATLQNNYNTLNKMAIDLNSKVESLTASNSQYVIENAKLKQKVSKIKTYNQCITTVVDE